MILQEIERVNQISKAEFQEKYLKKGVPVIIQNLSRAWPAYKRWNWQLFKEVAGHINVSIYKNNGLLAENEKTLPDDYMSFEEYIDIITQRKLPLRLYFEHFLKQAAPLRGDFSWPTHLMGGFLKYSPRFFVGGIGAVANMHYDIDLVNIFHTQFIGKKKVLLFPFDEENNLYRMPMTNQSAVSFVNWYHQPPDYEKYPALKNAKGYTATLEHGDTLFIPSTFWYHLEYLESGFALSLRALPDSIFGKLNSVYQTSVMRNVNTLLNKANSKWWKQKQQEMAKEKAQKKEQ